MGNDFRTIINEFINEIYNENWPTVNRMAADLLELIIETDTIKDIDILVLLLDEVSNQLNLRCKLLLKELKLTIIRRSSQLCSSVDTSEMPKKDKYGEIRIDNMTEDEIQTVLSNCQIHTEELPRVPGQEYKLCHRDNENESGNYVTYTVHDDGSITDDIPKDCDDLESGLNQLFSNVVNEEIRNT